MSKLKVIEIRAILHVVYGADNVLKSFATVKKETFLKQLRAKIENDDEPLKTALAARASTENVSASSRASAPTLGTKSKSKPESYLGGDDGEYGKPAYSEGSSSRREFMAYTENWEQAAVFTESPTNAAALLKKYAGMAFIDNDEENRPFYVISGDNVEFYSDIDPPQYGILAETVEDDDAFYLINDQLMNMIAKTRQPEGIFMVKKAEDEDAKDERGN